MAERNLPHIFLDGSAASERYQRPPRKIKPRPQPSPEDREGHGQRLRDELESAEAAGKRRREEQDLVIFGVTEGVYVTFESFPGLDLALESLDPSAGKVHPHLVSVRQVRVVDDLVEQATVFIPDGKLGYFLKRIEQYLETAADANPKNRKLLDKIEKIGLTSLEQLWTDPPADFPATDEAVWWEVWLRRRDGQELQRLRVFAEQSNFQLRDRTLAFTDRVVALIRAPRTGLAVALDVLDDLAELRRPRLLAEMIALEPASDQADWADDLQARTDASSPDAPAACVLDTGVDLGHPLLTHSLLVEDCHSCDPNWNVDDHQGHGTEMAGLALYGDVGTAVSATGRLPLRHRLEAVKILPPHGQNPPELYGAITATAASRVEIQAPTRKRVFSLAVTSDEASHEDAPPITVGQPSSWSAALDALSAGLTIETTADGMVFLDPAEADPQRLFIVAAGNVTTYQDDHLTRSDLEVVEDPAQAWNALTVGAFTDLADIQPDELGFDGWTPLAPKGELSPYSRTSVSFSADWPYKPDVLFEGGNVARSPDGTDYDWPHSFQRLTTKRRYPDNRLFTVTRQTSAATAQAAHMAASIIAEYPAVWPETVRALMVHSAEWTPPMKKQLDAAKQRQPRAALHRRYGMGVANLARAMRSASDALTLVTEDVLHPFDDGKMREIHFHTLPWPTEVLSELGEADVRLRVTLSYFIEPNPGSRGWVRRYNYASYGLRFDVRRATESNDQFRKRLNQLALAEEEKRPTSAGDSSEWYFGPDHRVAGSLHTDIWHGTAVDLASRGAVAVYPVTGWWKELKKRDRSDLGARYSLVVAIETPELDVDIWTPVAEQIGIPIEVAID